MPKTKKLSTTATIGIGVAAGLVVVIGGGYAAAQAVAGDRVPAKASVNGVAIGGLSPAQAVTKLQHELDADTTIKVRLGEQTVKLDPTDAGLAINYPGSVVKAGGGSDANPLRLLTVFFGGSDHAAALSVDQAKLDAQVAALAKQVDQPAVNAAVTYSGLTPKVTESKPGVVLDAAATAEAIKAGYATGELATASIGETQPEVLTAAAQQVAQGAAKTAVSAPVAVVAAGAGTFTVEPVMIASSLSYTNDNGTLAPNFNAKALAKQVAGPLAGLGLKEPVNARYTIKSGKPKLVPSVDGLGVAAADLGKALVPALSATGERRVSVEVSAQPAKVSTAEARKLGVTQVIGKFTTYFPGTAYRYNNIGKAAKLINGSFLMPGETFSMNQTLGERTTAAGWMAGGAIDGGKIVERLGGGISQATTTTFNAIYFAGLEDVQHKPHSLYFNRYPVGREATLDWVSVDMKFRNDSPYGVLLQASITGKPGSTGSVTVKVWSTKRYTIKSSTPVRSDYKAPGKTIYDDSADCIPQSAMTGFTVKFNRLFYQGKKLVKTEPFSWRYNSLTPVVCSKEP